MKRSGPPERRTPMRRDGDGARRFADHRSTLRSVSKSTGKKLAARAVVRAEVLARSGHRCEYADLIPEVQCRFYPPDRPGLEVDELRGGAHRSTEWLDPDSCRATCPAHHDWKTNHKRELLRRLEHADGHD